MSAAFVRRAPAAVEPRPPQPLGSDVQYAAGVRRHAPLHRELQKGRRQDRTSDRPRPHPAHLAMQTLHRMRPSFGSRQSGRSWTWLPHLEHWIVLSLSKTRRQRSCRTRNMDNPMLITRGRCIKNGSSARGLLPPPASAPGPPEQNGRLPPGVKGVDQLMYARRTSSSVNDTLFGNSLTHSPTKISSDIAVCFSPLSSRSSPPPSSVWARQDLILLNSAVLPLPHLPTMTLTFLLSSVDSES